MKTENANHKTALVLAIATVLILFWVIGAIIVRFQPMGMARAMIVMALAQALVTVIALIIGKQDTPYMSVFEIVSLNSFFVSLFLGSARLFQKAARE